MRTSRPKARTADSRPEVAISSVRPLTTAPAASTTVADRVHAEIFARIASGQYAAGERLTEPRLVDEHGVSRVPLREVLKRLAAEGVVDLYPNRGAVVRVLTRSDISEYFQVRMALEGFASRLAALRIGEDDNRDYFGRILEEIRRPHPDHGADAFTEHDERVHGGVVRRCGNGVLAAHWNLLQLPLHRLRHFASTRTWDFEASLRDHEQVVMAVVAADPAAAQESMCAHLDRVVTRLLLLSQAEFDEVFNPRLC